MDDWDVTFLFLIQLFECLENPPNPPKLVEHKNASIEGCLKLLGD